MSPTLLFVALLPEFGAERLICEFAALGAACDVAAPPNSFAARASARRQLFALPSRGGHALRALALSRGLDRYVAASRPDIIVPLDEFAAAVLRDDRLMTRVRPKTRQILAASVGAPEHFPVVRSRWKLCALAQDLGLRSPRAALLPNLDAARAAAAAFGYPLVLKRELTCGGGGVQIAPDADSLERGWRRSQWPARAKWALRAVPGFRSDGAPHMAQAFVAGRLAFRDASARDGVELSGVNFEAEPRDGFEVRPSRLIRRVENDEMAQTARALIASLRLTGFVSFDFLLDADGHAHLIEMNPRATGSAHLGRNFGTDLAAALIGAPTRPAGAAPEWIALFPRAFACPDGAQLSRAPGLMLDVPWSDVGLLEAYRRWLRAHNSPAARDLDRPPATTAPDAAPFPEPRAATP